MGYATMISLAVSGIGVMRGGKTARMSRSGPRFIVERLG